MSNHQSPATRHVFDNGLTLLIQENHFNQTVAISGRLKAGSMYDRQGFYGLSDVVANMLVKGTESRTWEEIAEATEFVGASIGAAGSTETVSIEGRLLSKDFDRVLDVLNDILRAPTFPQEEIEKHRHQVYSWLKAWEDETDDVADRLLREAVYPDQHPYHWRVQGMEESLKRIQRDALIDFHASYYRPDSLVLAIVGDVETQTIIEKIDAAMGNWTVNGEKPPFTIPAVEYGEKQIVVQSMMDKSQVNIELGHKGIARTNPDFYTINLMNAVLGGSAGIARLFGRVRDVQGLAYSVWSSFTPSMGEGLFHASAGVNPANVDKAIKSILHEIELMKSDGITEEEFTDAQNLIVGNFALALETNRGLAAVLLTAELYGLGLDYLEKHESIYRSITRAQVNTAAQRYLHPDLCSIAIAGPYQKTQ